MIRSAFLEKKRGSEKSFRWRSEEVSRLEGLSDAVFGFAITLIVVSLEVPKTFAELQDILLRGFFSFAICFMLLMLVWSWHYRFFRRYGLEDSYIIVLNGILLFVVLFYIYPLKFVFTLLTSSLFGFGTTVQGTNSAPQHMIEDYQIPTLMLIYGVGYLAVLVVFTLLYYYAYRKRAELELNELEIFRTQQSIQRYLLLAAITVASMLFAALGEGKYVSWSGYIYFLIIPVLTLHGSITGHRFRKLEASLAVPAQKDGPASSPAVPLAAPTSDE